MSTHPLSNELENQAIPVCNRADKVWNTKVTKGTMAIGINGVGKPGGTATPQRHLSAVATPRKSECNHRARLSTFEPFF